MKKKIIISSRKDTPWTGKEEQTPLEKLIDMSNHDLYAAHHTPLSESWETDFINEHEMRNCRYCGSTDIRKQGHTRSGIQRYYCSTCGRTFTPITGTLFDSHKLAIDEWVEYLMDLIHYQSFNAASRENRNSINTTRYWDDKLFIALKGIGDGMVLSGDVYIDETYVDVAAEERLHDEDGKRLRGISRSQWCIAIGCDSEHVYCTVEGKGHPSARRTWEAFGSHIKPGSTLIHDGECSHSILADRLSLKSRVYISADTKALPDSRNPLNPINTQCRFLKGFLRMHSGYNTGNLQDLLNLFMVIADRTHNEYEKVRFILDRMISTPVIVRYPRKRPDYYTKDNYDV